MPKGKGYGGKMMGGSDSKMRGMGAGGMMPGKKGKYGMKSHDGLKGGTFDVRDKGMKSMRGNARTMQASDRYK